MTNYLGVLSPKLLLLTMVVFQSSLALAEPGEGAYFGQRGQRLEQLSTELGLSKEQKAEMEELFKNQFEKIREINEDAHEQIKEVLNPEQFLKWQEIIETRRKRWRRE